MLDVLTTLFSYVRANLGYPFGNILSNLTYLWRIVGNVLDYIVSLFRAGETSTYWSTFFTTPSSLVALLSDSITYFVIGVLFYMLLSVLWNFLKRIFSIIF